MSSRKKVLNNVFTNWANLAVNLVISFFLAPFIVRTLGNTYYGIWVIMMQFTGYLYLLDFGVRESIIRYVSSFKASGDSKSLSDILSAGIIFYSGIGFISLAVSIVLALTFSSIFSVPADVLPTAKIVIILAGITIGQTLAFNVFGGILMGLQRYDIFNKIGIAFAFIRLFLVLVFLNLGYGIVALAIIQLVIGLGNNLSIYYYSRRLLHEANIPFRYTHQPLIDRLPIFKTLYNYSIYVLINNLGQKAIYYTDALIIGIFLNAPAVTFYAIAGNLIEYLRRLILISNTVLNPLVSELDSKKDTATIRKVLIQGGRFSLLLALPISVVYLFMGRQFIGLWMGNEYESLSGDVLFVLTLCVLLATPHSTISSVLYGMSRHKIIANLRIVEAVSNLTISIILVQSMGIVGVALGTAIPQIVLMVCVLPIYVLRMLRLSTREYVTQVYVMPILATIPFGACCYLLKNYSPSSSLLFFFAKLSLIMPVYLISVWFVCLSSEERREYSPHLRRLIPLGQR